MNLFKVGDIVILKSSKLVIHHSAEVPMPVMTITEYPFNNTVKEEVDKCKCTWYVAGDFKTWIFPVDALEIYTK